MEMKEHITREMLYEEVWTDPVSKVAMRYGISGVALGKVCRRHKIPIPPRGYWAKIKAGRSPNAYRYPAPRSLITDLLPSSLTASDLVVSLLEEDYSTDDDGFGVDY